MIVYIEHPGPLGPMLLAANEAGLCGAYFEQHSHFAGKQGWQSVQGIPSGALAAPTAQSQAILIEAARQLDQYFAGERCTFDLPLAAQGTAFQAEVWQGLCRIPYGQTWNYGQLARDIARPRAVRAVGAANARNPLSIIVPCHRVIGSNGTLVGYAGGIERKQFLLALEQRGSSDNFRLVA